ncbi:MAG: hypothetical protein ACP5GE_06760 [Thermoplasmata archaeon]
MEENLEKKIINAYFVEKYAEIALLMLFLKEEKRRELRNLAAKLVLESKEHENSMREILGKMHLSDYSNKRPDFKYTRESIEKNDFNELLLTLVKNEILAMNNYLEIYLKADRNEIARYFEDPEKEFYSIVMEMVFEELDHAKRIIKLIEKIRE